MRNLAVCFIAATTLLATAAVAQAPTTYEPIGTMSQLMVDIIYPTSDALFYVDQNPPKNDHDWNVLRGQALMLAESGNLLMMPGRARDQENWIRFSRRMTDLANTAYKAAQAKDMSAIQALNNPLSEVCIGCHYQYRPGYHRRRPPAASSK